MGGCECWRVLVQESVSGRGRSAGGCNCRRGESARGVEVWEGVRVGEGVSVGEVQVQEGVSAGGVQE